MNNLKDLQLFNDLKSVSKKYSNIQINISSDEVQINSKLKESLDLDDLRSKVNFVHSETLNQLSSVETKNFDTVINSLNKFSKDRFNLIKIYSKTLTSPSVRAVLDSTLEELLLINNSIENRDFKENKNTYLFLYNETVVNAFASFLAIKDFMDDQDAINGLSQGIFNQMKSISVVSKL